MPIVDPALAERAGLTRLQRDCLELHLKRISYRVIGDAMGRDESTIRHHVRVALSKLAKVAE